MRIKIRASEIRGIGYSCSVRIGPPCEVLCWGRATCKLGCLDKDNFEWRTSVQVLMLAS